MAAPDAPDHDFPREIGQPATRALLAAGYTRTAQLDEVPRADLLALHGLGPKALRILEEVLKFDGRHLG